MSTAVKKQKRERLTDAQLLMTITICIFFGMYILAMLLLGGGFLRAQQIFDLLGAKSFPPFFIILAKASR